MVLVFLVAQQWWNKSWVFEQLSKVGEGFLKYPSTKSSCWDDFSGSAGPVTAAVPTMEFRSNWSTGDSRQCQGATTGSSGLLPPAVPAIGDFLPNYFLPFLGDRYYQTWYFFFICHTLSIKLDRHRCCYQTRKILEIMKCSFNLPLFGVWWQYRDLANREHLGQCINKREAPPKCVRKGNLCLNTNANIRYKALLSSRYRQQYANLSHMADKRQRNIGVEI
jgi:hypothetical protein